MPVADRLSRLPMTAAQTVAERLNEALTGLTRPASDGDLQSPATVAELCRRAGVSRNTLYRYHPNVLEALRRLQHQQGDVPEKAGAACRALRLELKSLQGQLAKLAALVDHFYGAYRESQVLLERRDREISELRRSIKSPIQLRR